ncbi:MAG: hypothetical protein Q4C60_09055 [Eubacteriales bacterium]|nr:hypothetical protein [Eubacteriales bacterium]
MKKQKVLKTIYHVREDLEFQDPYIDADEYRERVLPDGRRLPYRYLHGGFRKKGVKFVFCFPEKEEYRGRFYQYLSPFPGPDEELASLEKEGEDDVIAFCLLHGAYYVESNMGSKQMFGANPEPQLVWKASAAAAEYSRMKAMEIYGGTRPYGYVFGGSGGGYKTMACIENTDAWDGAVPYVIGSPYSLPNTITLHAQGQRVLRHVFGKIVDALDAGGSGDMYGGLTPDEAAMLREITLMGYPPQAWFPEAMGVIDDGSLPVLLPGIKANDPSYFREFWEVPGYLGAQEGSNAQRDRLQFRGVVRSVHLPGETLTAAQKNPDGVNGVDTAWRKMLTDGKDAWIELEEVPQGEDLYLKGVTIGFADGGAQGKQLLLGDICGNALVIGMCYGMDDLSGVLSLVQPGDTVTLDNSDYIAVQSYYRHQVPPDRDFHAWDQFRKEDGTPAIPQRPDIMGPSFCGTGTVQDGCIQGKVIVIQSLMDESTCPWCGDWYRRKVEENGGGEENFRLYYMERCMHGDVSRLGSTMIVNYLGALRQALLDVSDWAERGITPLPGTVYEMEGGSVRVEVSAAHRKGLQPTVSAEAVGQYEEQERVNRDSAMPELAESGKRSGGDLAVLRPGESVLIRTQAVMPMGAGAITAVEYAVSQKLADDMAFTPVSFTPFAETTQSAPDRNAQENPVKETGAAEEVVCRGARAQFTLTFTEPGTYFVTTRAQGQRRGDADDLFTQIRNQTRTRIVVTEEE